MNTNVCINIRRTNCIVTCINIDYIQGCNYRGIIQLHVDNKPTESVSWDATYKGMDRWEVRGQGAIDGNGERVKNLIDYPFSLNPQVNDGLREIISDFLNSERKKGNTTACTKISEVQPVSQPKIFKDDLATSEKLEGAGMHVEFEPDILLIDRNEVIPFQPGGNGSVPFTTQPRRYFDSGELQDLATSMEQVGQMQPIIVCRSLSSPGKFEIIDGERRWRASELIKSNETKFLRVLVAKVHDKRQQHLMSFVLNFNRSKHTLRELSDAIKQHTDAGVTIKIIAVIIGKSPTTINKALSLQALHDDLKPLLDPPTEDADRISLSQGSILAKIDKAHQIEVWKEAKKQPTKQLIDRALKHLGKPYMVFKRHTEPDNRDLCRTIERTLRRLSGAMMDLMSIEPNEWHRYYSSGGDGTALESIAILNQIEGNLITTKCMMTRIRHGLRKEHQQPIAA